MSAQNHTAGWASSLQNNRPASALGERERPLLFEKLQCDAGRNLPGRPTEPEHRSLDPFRVPRRWSAFGAAVCVVLITPLALAVPEEGWEPFQGVNHVSNFSRSGVYAASQLMSEGWFDAATTVTDPFASTR